MMNHSIIESGGMKVEVKGKRVWINGVEVCNGAPKRRIDGTSLFIGFCIGLAIFNIVQSVF